MAFFPRPDEEGDDDGDQVTRPIGPAQVQAIATALAGVTDEQLRAGYDPERMTEEDVYPEVWDRPEELDNLIEVFHEAREYYAQAAKKGMGVVLQQGI
jgi:hypothetical protein